MGGDHVFLGHHPSPRLIFIPYPLQGHITPLLQLATLLAARWSFRVILVTTEHEVKRLLQAQQYHLSHIVGGYTENNYEAYGQSDDSVNRDNLIQLMGVPDGLPPSHHRHALSLDFFDSLSTFQRQVEDLAMPNIMHTHATLAKDTVMISDSFLTWTHDLANRWAIRRVFFWPNSITTFACSLRLQGILDQITRALPGMAPADLFQEEVYNQRTSAEVDILSGMPRIPISAMPFKTLHGEVSAQWLHATIKEQFDRIHEAHCVIINSFEALEDSPWQALLQQQDSDLPVNVYSVGPLLLSNSQDCDFKDDECIQWLSMQPSKSVLYIALGTIATLTIKEIYELVDGLASCNQAFLWVLKGSHDARSECSIGADNLPKELEDYIQHKVGGLGKLTQWAPQSSVLTHPAIAGFLSHCGWNSVLESLTAGVPIIGRPSFMDQVTNCWWAVNHLEAGVELRSVEKGEVAKTIRTLMGTRRGDAIRSRCLRFQACGQSWPNDVHLQNFAQSILAATSNSK